MGDPPARLRVRLAQLAPRPREVQANVERVCALLADDYDADLFVLPELFLCGYQLADVEAVAIDADGAEVDALREAARRADAGLIVGAAERVGGGVANSAFCLDRAGDLAAVYRKTHLFGAERDVYVAGDQLAPVELCGRTMGPMICFDMEFPEVARSLTLAGAELLVTISANPLEFAVDHDVFARARALESGLPHVYVNRVGEESGIRFAGGSMAVDPDARVPAEAGRDGESVVHAEIGAPGRRDERTHYTDFMREELYP